jgi:hypothetical protein
MGARGKLMRSSRWKTGPSKGQRPLGNECCVTPGDSWSRSVHSNYMGVGLSPERSDIAGAESFHSLEGNMCGAAMRGVDALPGSKAASRRRCRRTKRDEPVAERSARGPNAAERMEPRAGGNRASKAGAGCRARQACRRSWNAYGKIALPSHIPGGSRMRASRACDSVRGRAMKSASLPLPT